MAAEARRFHELDALRGLAAVSVVFLHFVDMFYPYDLAAQRTPLQKTLLAVTSPLYRGHEAVFLFFVLSAFVLALPYLNGVAQPYPSFLFRRIARIYLPYLAALGLAVLGAAIWHGHLYLGAWAENSWTVPPDWHSVASHVLFVGQYNWFAYNCVFWSLVVEMRISLVFPLLVALITRLRWIYALGLAGCCLVLFRILERAYPASSASLETVAYFSVFVVGIILAQHMGSISHWYENRTRNQRLAVVVSILIAYFFGHLLPHWSKPVTFYGAVGAILLSLNSKFGRSLLDRSLPRFLGRISYSLYLVHVPILYVLTFTLHTRIRYTLLFILYVVAALCVATLFYTVVERPCMQLSRRIGRHHHASQPIRVVS